METEEIRTAQAAPALAPEPMGPTGQYRAAPEAPAKMPAAAEDKHAANGDIDKASLTDVAMVDASPIGGATAPPKAAGTNEDVPAAISTNGVAHKPTGESLPYLPPEPASAAGPGLVAPVTSGEGQAPAAEASAGSGPATTPVAKPRAQKTPFQKESLEAAFKLAEQPTEEMRKLLGERIGLTEPQIVSWFQHRRQRKRREAERARERSAGPSAEEASETEGDAPGSGPVVPEDLAKLLQAAARALPVPYREDGPPLGASFDDPPGPALSAEDFVASAARAATASLAAAEAVQNARKRRWAEPLLDEGGAPGSSAKKKAGATPGSSGAKPPRPPSAPLAADLERLRAEDEARAAQLAEKARLQLERLDANLRREQERVARERERADTRVARERERELLRLEMERRRHLERTQKEQKREEERRAREEARLRAAQEREERRAAQAADKERRAEERRAALAARRRERDEQRMLQAQEKAALRLRARDFGSGPPDDLDLEWEQLLSGYRAAHGLEEEEVAGLGEDDPPPRDGLPPLPRRAAWPPAGVELVPALPPGLEAEGASVLESWSFLNAFCGELGLAPFSADALLSALALGRRSRLLGAVHCGLLRTLQADAEEAWAAGPAGVYGGLESALGAAHLLEESWAWGFDPDAWRAHLNAATWPEVARQVAIAAGLGRARPKKRKGERPKVGRAGEDVAADESGSGGGLRLRLPARFGLGTVKAAAWSVLAEAGPAGLKVDEIARRIQRRGLRDLRTSKTPEASVAGALGRDVLFQRVDLGTYALAAVVAYEARMAARGEEVKLDEDAPPPAPGEDKVAPSRGFVQVIVDDDANGGGGGAKGAGSGDGSGGASKEAKDGKVDGQDADKVAKEDDDDEDDDDEHDDDSEELDGSSDDDASSSDEEAGAKSSSLGGTPGKKAGAGGKAARENQASRAAGWVEALKDRDYDALSLADRAGMLGALCYLAMQAPSVRDVMERRIEEQQRLKRQLWEESKLEKRRRQIENAQRLRAAAEEAQRAVERYRHLAPSGAASAAASVADRGAKAEDVEQGVVQSPAQKSRDDVAGVDEVKEEKAEAEAKAEAGATAPTPAIKSEQGAAPSAASCEGDVKESGSSPMDTNEGEAAEAMDTNEGETAGATRTPGAASPVKKEETTLPDRSAEDPALAMEAHVSAAQAIAAAERAAAEREAADREAARQRQAQRAEQVLREMELSSVRLEALGADRRRALYWRLLPSGEVDAASASRVFVESERDGALSLLRDEASLDALMAALERRGAREAGLYASLLRHREAIAAGMPVGPLARPAAFEELPEAERARAERERSEDLAACALTRARAGQGAAGWSPFAPGDGQETSRIKADLLRLKDAAQGAGALLAGFDSGAWAGKLFEPGTLADLRARLAELEGALAPEALSPWFPRRPRLVPGAWVEVDGGGLGGSGAGTEEEAAFEDEEGGGGDPMDEDAAAPGAAPPAVAAPHSLDWLPATEASLALRIFSLDAALVGADGAPPRNSLPRYARSVRPSAEPAPGGVALDQPVTVGGRARTVPFPPLPRKLLYGPAREFSFPQAQFLRDVANNSDSAIAVARPKGVGRGRGRGRGRGSALAAAEGRRPGINRSAPRIVGSSKKERRAMLTQKSELAKEFENSDSDSERHYGTDYEEEAEFARQAGGRAGQGARASVEPSVVGTEDDEALSPDEESAEEELSDDE